jgi:hypothetical protein
MDAIMQGTHIGKWLFLSIAFLLLPLSAVAASKKVPTDYNTIQAAINALVANPSLGDTVIIEVGTYTENITVRGAANLTIEGEEAARTHLQPANSGAILTIDASSSVVIRNLSWDTATQGIVAGNSTDISLTNNIFAMGSAGTAVRVSDVSSVTVVNNVFYQNKTAVSREADGVVVRNNILSSNTLAIDTPVTGNIDHNCFYDNQSDGEQGDNAVTNQDPRFVDAAAGDFHLKLNSPCINQGSGTDGIDSSTADIGAYGGADADVKPFPVQNVVVIDDSAQTGNAALRVSWSANGSYLVSDATDPGGYFLYYDSDSSGSPYNGTDGSAPSPIDVGNVTSYTLENLSPAAAPPSAPVLATPQPYNETLQLSWSAVSGATSYTLYYGVAAANENNIALGNVTHYTLQGLTNGASYHLAVSAVAQPRYYVAVTAYDNTGEPDHVSDYSTEKSLALGSAVESARSNEQIAMPEAVAAYPQLPNEGCFIATAAFGYYSADQVQVLQNFRDRFLLGNAPGRAFVRVYYTYGPKLAQQMNEHPASKPVVRALLYPLILFAALCLTSPAGVITIMCLIAALFTYRHARQAARS